MGLCRLTCWIVVVTFGVVGHLALTQTAPCSGHGDLERGLCVCHPGFKGVNCSITDIEACKAPGDTSICSGRGDCMDGSCLCLSRGDDLHRYTGQWCQCDDHNCPYSRGEVCGGRDRGMCACGKCICEEGYSGEDCSCSTSVDNCQTDNNGGLCSNRGSCVCNQCQCSNPYIGPKCSQMDVGRSSTKSKQMTPFDDGMCTLWTQCVLCVVFNTGEKDEEECREDCSVNRMLEVSILPDDPEIKVCKYTDPSDNCTVTFSHTDENFYAMSVYVLTVKECPPPHPQGSAGGQMNKQDDGENKTGSNGVSHLHHSSYVLGFSAVLVFLSISSKN